MAASSIARALIRPPSLAVLPSRKTRVRSMLSSTFLHLLVMAAWIFLPLIFPSPVFIQAGNISKPAAPEEAEPLAVPQLPALADSGSGNKARKAGPGVGSGAVEKPADPAPQKPDFIGPQEIVSYAPNPVNRIQTIRRPDLINPPNIKYPLRLQSMVSLPAAARPVLAPPPRPSQPVSVETAQQLPIAELALPNPALTLVPKQVSVAPSDPATPLQTVASIPVPAAEPETAPRKAVVVVNAVNVPADPTVAVPDAQLAGSFVVGPAPAAGATEKSLAAGTGRPTEGGPANGSGPSSESSLSRGTGIGSGSSHTAGPGGGNRTDAGTGVGIVPGPGNGGGNGSAPGTGGKTAAGGGTGSGTTRGLGSGNGAPGSGAGSGGNNGITISGGVPGRNNATIGKAVPLNRTYGMMIISGGNNGGASRDLGVFDRNETVYTVTIPMKDAGGGPDWTMQYALVNPAQAGSGMLAPPFAQKKVSATMAASQLVGPPGPVFISGIIDENGKLQSLRAIRAQDARAQPAIRALQQWEFLPAQLDGKAVASRVLIGVTVTVE